MLYEPRLSEANLPSKKVAMSTDHHDGNQAEALASSVSIGQ